MKQQSTSLVWGAALLLAAAVAGCSSSGGESTEGDGDTGAKTGSTSGTAGSSPSTTTGAGGSGTTTGAGGSGTTTATGGSGTTTATAGSGAATATAGSGAATETAGTSGAAGGGASDSADTFSCGPKSTKTPAELYSAMTMAFLPKDAMNSLPCAFSSCHNTGKKIAMLALPFGGNLVDILVDKPSCEVATMKLVASGGGDDALKNSWLWHKLAGPIDGTFALVPDPAWGKAGSCGQMGGEFGMRMPVSGGAEGVGPEKLAVAKEWICNGAPGM